MSGRNGIIAFCGYDFKNVGDDAFMLVVDHLLSRERRRQVGYVTSSYIPAPAQARSIRPIYGGLSTVRGGHLPRLAFAATQSQALVFFGGSIMHETCHFERERIKILTLRALSRGGPAGALGLSIGPILTERQKKAFVSFSTCLDFITVRDEKSLATLRNYGVRTPAACFFDLAALLLDAVDLPTGRDQDRSWIGIAPCAMHVGGESDSAQMEKIASALRAGKHRHIRIFCFNGHKKYGDRPMAQKISDRLGDDVVCEIIDYSPDPVAFLRLVSECKLMIAMRLHAAVFSYLGEVPLVILSYHQKCAGFAAEIGLSPSLVLKIPFSVSSLTVAIARAFDCRAQLPVKKAVESARCHWHWAKRNFL